MLTEAKRERSAGVLTVSPSLAPTEIGPSIWSHHLGRDQISSEVRRRIGDGELRGMTVNPSTLANRIVGSRAYDEPIRKLSLEGKDAVEIYDAVTIEDAQLAADLFRPGFERLGGDGLVSLGMSPRLAYDTRGMISEARRLWKAVDRPNVMIEIPATRAGVPAIEALVSDGINVAATMLFDLGRYQEVADAYLAGLESLAARQRPDGVASVASFFLSPIDTTIDRELDALEHAHRIRPDLAAIFRGQVAIATARLAYQMFQRIRGSERWKMLAAKGARPQRLLWSSASTENAAVDDMRYLEALIGNDTINAVPLAILDAYRDHGKPQPHIEARLDQANAVLYHLHSTGIDVDTVMRQLEDEGVRKLVQAYDRLLDAISEGRAAALREATGSASCASCDGYRIQTARWRAHHEKYHGRAMGEGRNAEREVPVAGARSLRWVPRPEPR